MAVSVSYPLPTAFTKAVAKTWEMSIFSLKMLGKMVTGELSWKNLSGPITIADYAGQSAKLGWVTYVSFIALISVSLGVLNLLPIPMLDGGHLMYYAVETLKGSPVSERTMEIGGQVGLALLIGLMAFALYNDINRLVTTRRPHLLRCRARPWNDHCPSPCALHLRPSRRNPHGPGFSGRLALSWLAHVE